MLPHHQGISTVFAIYVLLLHIDRLDGIIFFRANKILLIERLLLLAERYITEVENMHSEPRSLLPHGASFCGLPVKIDVACDSPKYTFTILVSICIILNTLIHYFTLFDDSVCWVLLPQSRSWSLSEELVYWPDRWTSWLYRSISVHRFHYQLIDLPFSASDSNHCLYHSYYRPIAMIVFTV